MKLDYDDKIMNEIVTPEYPTDPLEFLGERSFNEPREVPVDEIGTNVQEFYRDTTIFLTGATGFIGYVLLDKLLRSCPHIKLIYVLIRPKKGKSPQERLEQIFDNRLYKRLKHEVPGFMKKLVVISGDLEEPDLGISEADRQILIKEVDIICHCGANVRFDEKLVRAIRNKVYSTQDILKLAKECKKLKTLVYVSTAYSFCTEKQVEEKISPMPVHYKSILETISSSDEEEVNSRESEFLMGWPNTYTFSKAIAESVIIEEGQGLPVAVFRPSIVISSYREPVKGWVNNYYGPIGIIAGIRTGILHVYADSISNPFLNTVPVDFTANALICAAKDTAEMFQTVDPKEFKIPVYNFANVESNIPIWQVLQIYNANASWEWPTVNAVWYYFTLFIPNHFLFFLCSFFLHTIPGYIFDAVLICCGKKPLLTQTYKKYHSSVMKTLGYFIKRRWKFETERVQNLWNNLSLEDQELFFFNLAEISWEEHCRTGTLGMRVYLFKDEIHTLPKARKHYRRLYYVHIILKYVFYGTLFLILIKLYNFISNCISFY